MENITNRKQVKYHKLGVIFSFIIHLLFFFLALYIKKQTSQENRKVVVEFNITNIIKTGEYETDANAMETGEIVRNEASIPALVEQEIKNTVEEEILEKPDEVRKEKMTVSDNVNLEIEEKPDNKVLEKSVEAIKKKIPSDRVKPETKVMMDERVPAKAVEVTKEVKQTVADTMRESKRAVNSDKREQSGGIPKSDIMPHELEQSAENQYIKDHFDNINKIIRINISYPYKARKMFMQGNVLISFVVCLDGSVKDIKINKSSGFSTLDDNAEKAIRKASPFPPPPVEVKIVIPITYKLNA
ncbi:MAG: energy transducer TonB [Candidatus Scalindua sp.]|nr:energy transducer TonB [Candidatus Scalindua sp.]